MHIFYYLVLLALLYFDNIRKYNKKHAPYNIGKSQSKRKWLCPGNENVYTNLTKIPRMTIARKDTTWATNTAQ